MTKQEKRRTIRRLRHDFRKAGEAQPTLKAHLAVHGEPEIHPGVRDAVAASLDRSRLKRRARAERKACAKAGATWKPYARCRDAKKTAKKQATP